MMKRLLNRFFLSNKALLLQEAQQISGFMRLLMKQRNTGVRWTDEEIKELRVYLRRLTIYAPILACIFLPGGFLFLPLLARTLDRRKIRRIEPAPHEISRGIENSPESAKGGGNALAAGFRQTEDNLPPVPGSSGPDLPPRMDRARVPPP
jgi:hypothetical protein